MSLSRAGDPWARCWDKDFVVRLLGILVPKSKAAEDREGIELEDLGRGLCSLDKCSLLGCI